MNVAVHNTYNVQLVDIKTGKIVKCCTLISYFFFSIFDMFAKRFYNSLHLSIRSAVYCCSNYARNFFMFCLQPSRLIKLVTTDHSIDVFHYTVTEFCVDSRKKARLVLEARMSEARSVSEARLTSEARLI